MADTRILQRFKGKRAWSTGIVHADVYFHTSRHTSFEQFGALSGEYVRRLPTWTGLGNLTEMPICNAIKPEGQRQPLSH